MIISIFSLKLKCVSAQYLECLALLHKETIAYLKNNKLPSYIDYDLS